MKKILQNPIFVRVCALALILGSTVWNLNRNLDKRADAVEDIWEEKYGMEEKLEERCSSASQLWSVLRDYPALEDECGALRNAYNALYETDLEPENAHELFTLNEDLSEAAGNLMSAAQEVQLQSEDEEWATRYYSNMVNAQRLMDDSDYHEAQSEFARLLKAPHVALLRGLLDVDFPEEFA